VRRDENRLERERVKGERHTKERTERLEFQGIDRTGDDDDASIRKKNYEQLRVKDEKGI